MIDIRDFIENIHDPVRMISLELKTSHIEVYQVKLLMMAELSGLSLVLDSFPLISHIFGVIFTTFVIIFVFITPKIRWSYNLIPSEENCLLQVFNARIKTEGGNRRRRITTRQWSLLSNKVSINIFH